MTKDNKKFIRKYLEEARESTSYGEHLFAMNVLLNEIASNTAPDIVGVEDEKVINKADESNVI